MDTIKLTLEYDGTAYHGWQRQPGSPTVQGILEEAIRVISGDATQVVGASRTDARVHALGQVAHFKSPKPLAAERWRQALNAHLPSDIAVLASELVPPEFDARRSARMKTYHYRLLLRQSPSPLRERHVLHCPSPLDVGAMEEAARHLVGLHDFSAFQAADCGAESPMRSVAEARFFRSDDELIFMISAPAFLRHMVRIIVGSLLEVGRERRTPEEFRLLLASRDRKLAGKTMPPHGLYLVQVEY